MVKCPYCNYEGEFKFGKTGNLDSMMLKEWNAPNAMVCLTIIRV